MLVVVIVVIIVVITLIVNIMMINLYCKHRTSRFALAWR